MDSLIYHVDHRTFLNDVVGQLEGWLNEHAAITTMRLLDLQEAEGIEGVLFEIGVCVAKYFSVLLRSGARTGSRCFGLDTFQWLPEEKVAERIQALLPDAVYTFLSGPSTAFTDRDLMEAFGGSKARFISIDGSHERDDVVWDLRLAEMVLSPDGLVAVDDFLNPVTLGVNDGTHTFFATPRALEPVALLDNKLMLGRPARASFYRQALEKMAEAYPDEFWHSRFLQNRESGRHAVEQKLWGKPVLTFA